MIFGKRIRHQSFGGGNRRDWGGLGRFYRSERLWIRQEADRDGHFRTGCRQMKMSNLNNGHTAMQLAVQVARKGFKVACGSIISVFIRFQAHRLPKALQSWEI